MALKNFPYEIVEKIATWIPDDLDLQNYSTVVDVDTTNLPFMVERYRNILSTDELDFRLKDLLLKGLLETPEVVALTKAGARIRGGRSPPKISDFLCLGHIESVCDMIKKHSVDINFFLDFTSSGEILNINGTEPGLTLLHVAVIYHYPLNFIPLIKYLTSVMTTEAIEAIGDDGQTALHYAADKNLKIVEILTSVMTSAGIEKLDDFGLTALHAAAMCSGPGEHSLIIQHLLSKMSSNAIGIQNRGGCTVLHLVAGQPTLYDLIPMLAIRMTPNALNAQNNSGGTALHWALYSLLPLAASHLVPVMPKSGLEASDLQGHTALHLTSLMGSKAFANLLLKKFPTDDELQKLPRAHNDLAKTLIEFMSEEAINAKDINGRTAMDLANPTDDECFDIINCI